MKVEPRAQGLPRGAGHLPRFAGESSSPGPRPAPCPPRGTEPPAAQVDPRAAALPRAFILLALGQTVAMLGSSMAEFGLGLWVVQASAGVGSYASMVMFAVLPGLLCTPLAGRWVDRHDLRRLLLAADGAALAGVSILALLARTGHLRLPEVMAVVALLSACLATQRLASASAVATIVPSAGLARANGLLQLGGALPQLVAPVLAGWLASRIGLGGLLSLQVGTSVFGLAMLLRLRLAPRPAGPERADRSPPWAVPGSVFRTTPSLRWLLLYGGAESFALGVFMVLLAPLVLRTHGPAVLGSLASSAGLGMVTGAGLLASPLGRVPPLRLVLAGASCLALGLIGVAASKALAAWYLAVFALAAGQAMSAGIQQSMWQRAVPAESVGRALAARQFVLSACLPLAAMASAPLVDRLLAPAMASGRGWTAPLRQIVGTGSSAAICAMLVLTALAWSVLAACMFASGRLRPFARA